jgi:hypothetical protein
VHVVGHEDPGVQSRRRTGEVKPLSGLFGCQLGDRPDQAINVFLVMFKHEHSSNDIRWLKYGGEITNLRRYDGPHIGAMMSPEIQAILDFVAGRPSSLSP